MRATCSAPRLPAQVTRYLPCHRADFLRRGSLSVAILIQTPVLAYTWRKPGRIVQEVGIWIEVEPAMTLQFAVLGSGSRGNSALVSHEGGTGLLIDIGLGPRALEQRLASVQSNWSRISAVLLTHTPATTSSRPRCRPWCGAVHALLS